MDVKFFQKSKDIRWWYGSGTFSRGMRPQGTLWSATAILNEKYHKLLYDTHVDS